MPDQQDIMQNFANDLKAAYERALQDGISPANAISALATFLLAAIKDGKLTAQAVQQILDQVTKANP